MPNIDYDTRTPDEKKKLMKGKLLFNAQKAIDKDEKQPADSAEDDRRGSIHRHTA